MDFTESNRGLLRCDIQSGAHYHQLFTMFIPFADAAFPVVFALMSRKTRALYSAMFRKIKDLVPDFASTSAKADFEEASVSAFQDVFGDINVAG